MSVNVNVNEVLRLREIAERISGKGFSSEAEEIIAICNNIDSKRKLHNSKVKAKKAIERKENPLAQRSQSEKSRKKQDIYLGLS